MSKSYYNGARIGFILSEEDTEKVLLIMDRLDKDPDEFARHCIDTLWKVMTNERSA